MLSEFERAVRFFILNRITFSGVVDSGGYSQAAYEKRFTSSSIDRAEVIAHYLSDVKITNEDYTEALTLIRSFVKPKPPNWTGKLSKKIGNLKNYRLR